ncbi:MAG TPA: EAL domain-containing protein [Burkholderiales bacterium]|nr:EAL domain-containing protein [Burkholderiales bacterium]
MEFLREQISTLRNIPTSAVSEKVYAERVRITNSLSPIAVSGSMAAAAIAMYTLWDNVGRFTWTAWASLIVACILLLIALAASYRMARPAPDQAARWALRYEVIGAANGVAWGVLGFVFLPATGSADHTIFLFVVVALIAGAVSALAPIFSVFLMFTFPIVLGAVLPLMFNAREGSLELALLLSALYLVCASAALRMSQTMGDNLQNVFEKQDLLSDLSATQGEMEKTNEALMKEVEERERVQAALEISERHFRVLVETSGDVIWSVDAEGRYTYINGPAVEAILGYQADQVIGRPLTDFAHATSATALAAEFLALKETGVRLNVQGEYMHRAGRVVYLSINALALHDADGKFIGATGTAADVTAIKAAEVQLRQTLAEQHAILDAAIVGIAFVQCGEIVRVNAELEKMFGYPRGTMTGMAIHNLYAVEGSQVWVSTVDSVVAGGHVYEADQMFRRQDGSRFWCHLAARAIDEGSLPDGAIWVVQDISERKQKEQLVEHVAHHDALTGLPNRVLLRDRLEQAIKRAMRAKSKVGVLFLDLDRFKVVNDTIGHDGGDQLLRTVTERLQGCIRSEDTVARQGGDEFIVVLPEIRSAEDAANVAAKILMELAKPIPIFGSDFYVTGSIGISLYPDHGRDVQALLKHADTAMYHAKELGKDTYCVFSEELNLRALEEARLESALRTAIDRQQLQLYYQPRVDLQTGKINSMEALLRWNHPELGPVSPDRFIPVAEQAGLIGRLGDWVLRRACADMTYLHGLGFEDIGVSVNISQHQFSQPELVDTVRNVLAEFNFDPRWLELELTESAIAQNADQAVQILRNFEALGIGLAIDDFGTGYSSLSHLKRFPIRTLKIDRSFVDGLPRDEDDVAIALAIIAMAKRLKMRVVAEGVETIQQRQFLARHRCDEGQGYVFSRPAPLQEIEALLKAARDVSMAPADLVEISKRTSFSVISG